MTLTDGEEGGEQEVLIREVTVNTLVDRWGTKNINILKLLLTCIAFIRSILWILVRGAQGQSAPNICILGYFHGNCEKLRLEYGDNL